MDISAIERFADNALDRFADQIDARWTKAANLELAKWEKRWPRHSFKVAQSHGLLLFRVSPPICGETDPTNLTNRYGVRGAIADLAELADAMSEAHAKLEWRVGTPETDWISAT